MLPLEEVAPHQRSTALPTSWLAPPVGLIKIQACERAIKTMDYAARLRTTAGHQLDG